MPGWSVCFLGHTWQAEDFWPYLGPPLYHPSTNPHTFHGQENEWGITLEDNDAPAASDASSASAPAASLPSGQSNLPEGVSFAYSAPTASSNEDTVQVDSGKDVDDLQAMLKSLQSK